MLDDDIINKAAEDKHLDKQRSLKIATLALAWSSVATAFASATSVTLTASALRFNFSDLMPLDVLDQPLVGLGRPPVDDGNLVNIVQLSNHCHYVL